MYQFFIFFAVVIENSYMFIFEVCSTYRQPWILVKHVNLHDKGCGTCRILVSWHSVSYNALFSVLLVHINVRTAAWPERWMLNFGKFFTLLVSSFLNYSNDQRRRRQRVRQKSCSIGLVKKKKKNNFFMQHTFCAFLCRLCTTTTWNFLGRCFVEDLDTRGRIFLSLSKPGCVPQN